LFEIIIFKYRDVDLPSSGGQPGSSKCSARFAKRDEEEGQAADTAESRQKSETIPISSTGIRKMRPWRFGRKTATTFPKALKWR
jgi:hypothetical protein